MRTANRHLAVHPAYHRRRCGLPHPPVRDLLPRRVRGGLAPAALLDPLEGLPAAGQLHLLRLVALRHLPRALLPPAHRPHAGEPGLRVRHLPGRGPGPAAPHVAGRGSRPRGLDLLQVRRVDRRRGQPGPRGHDAPGRRHLAHRGVVLRLPGHQLRRGHLSGPPPPGVPARLRHLPVVLPPPGGRADRAGAGVRASAAGAGRPPADRCRPGVPAHHVRAGQEGHHRRAAVELDRQAGLQQPDPVRRGGQPLRRLRLRHPDLRRLLRLHRHRHRPGPAARHPLPAELQRPLRREHAAGLLAPVAHDAVALAPGLPVHRAGRQPEGRGPHLPQPVPHHVPRRAVARRQLDVRGVGLDPWRLDGAGAALDAAPRGGRAGPGRAHGPDRGLAGHVQRRVPGVGVLPGPEPRRRLRRPAPDRHRLGDALGAGDATAAGRDPLHARGAVGAPALHGRAHPALLLPARGGASLALGVGFFLLDVLGPQGVAEFIYFQF